METIKVKTILQPYRKETSTNYTVRPEDKVIYAVELMVAHNMKTIAVVRNGRPIGMIRLEDAFEKLGLRMPCNKL